MGLSSYNKLVVMLNVLFFSQKKLGKILKIKTTKTPSLLVLCLANIKKFIFIW